MDIDYIACSKNREVFNAQGEIWTCRINPEIKIRFFMKGIDDLR
jgi:hypothetical protein